MSNGMKKGPFGRPIRVPLGTRNVLTAPQRLGYVRRFVNDEPGRVKMYEEAGYTVVKQAKEEIPVGDPKIGKSTEPGSKVGVSVGAGTHAVLMEIKKEYYDEDQRAKQNKISVSENDMKRKLNTKAEGMYGGVSIT